jgi:hypothetical protein
VPLCTLHFALYMWIATGHNVVELGLIEIDMIFCYYIDYK